jgi:uncharacterized membrane protein
MNIKTLTLASLLVASTFTTPVFAMEGKNSDEWQKKREQHMEEVLKEFPESKRELVKSTLSEGRDSGKATYEQIKTLKETMKSALTAETFDEKAFRDASGKIHTLHGERMKDMNERIVTLAKQLNAEERNTLLKLMPHGKRHHKGGHGKKCGAEGNKE